MIYTTLIALMPLFSPCSLEADQPQASSIRLCSDSEEHTVVLYYTNSCPYCRQVLKFLKKNQIQILMKNVNEDKEAKKELLEIGGYLQVPCLFIDGKPLYNSDNIIKWLSEHKNPKTD